MIAIPEQFDPTLQAMYLAIEQEQHKRDKRDYLGASLIGNECVRQIWYNYNNFPRKPFNAETLMNFEDGHRTEELTAERLKATPGIELITHGPDGKQLGFSALGGKFKGHYDGKIRGLIQAPKSWHIWEGKCSAIKQYNKFKSAKAKHGEKNALREWNGGYYAQAQLYMHFEQIERHYLTVALAGGREYESCRTNYDGAVAERYIDRADKILNTTHAPPKISEKPDFYMCRWCNFKEICHGK